jgi:hypothetical protein
MEGQRCWQNAEAIGDYAGRQTRWPLRYQQTKHIKAGFCASAPSAAIAAFFSMSPTAYRHFDDP